MYDVYYNKQDPKGLAQSPDTDLGFAGNARFDRSVSIRQGIGITAAASRVIPAVTQFANITLKAQGSYAKQRRFQNITQAITIGTSVATLGVGATIGVEAVRFGLEQYQSFIDNRIETANQEYRRQLNGAAVDRFVGRGRRYD